MMKILNKIASVLALIIGATAIYAGGKVLLGQPPGYNVIDWLPVYNFSIGVITVSITTILLWKNSRFGLSAALATLGLHSLVMVVLQTAYRATVASDSIQAMTLRITVWTVIFFLMFIQSRISKPEQNRKESGVASSNTI